MINKLAPYFAGKRIAILGFGMEGQSSYQTIRNIMPDLPLVICDKNPNLGSSLNCLHDDNQVELYIGSSYLAPLHKVDLIIKSPGIPYKVLDGLSPDIDISSQTSIFIQIFRNQITGITGTKGKSTTSSLLYHMLKASGKDTLLVGNIGIPPFDLLHEIHPETHIVYEMSSHQLEHISVSPSGAALLNIYQEHLDHYPSYRHYQNAKFNIANWQQAGDILVYNPNIPNISVCLAGMHDSVCKVALNQVVANGDWVAVDGDQVVCHMPGMGIDARVDIAKRNLPGIHNMENIAAAVAMALAKGISPDEISKAVESFHGLPHRLEFIAEINNIRYYNDSISTIPESAMAAIEAFPATKTIILGGMNRGIDYAPFMQYLARAAVTNMVFMGDAGERMYAISLQHPAFNHKHLKVVDTLEEAALWASKNTPPGGVCLLSPAAASYNEFNNFRERGDAFRQIIMSLSK